MGEVIKVGIADWKLCKNPDTITTIGLGSCVGIVLYTATDDSCGMVHIMLPSSKEIKNNTNRAKFADTGIEDLLKALEKCGIKRQQLVAKIAGGAAMFQFSGKTDLASVGERNVKAVKEVLAAFKIPIVAEDTGKDYGRTIVFDNVAKKLTIRSAGKGEKVI
ncbi:MAG: chemotaxis protein CheD [Lachnospiraceae bacterium]|nr:chemotaxis protein CheD [Lachnospiraceae bacterium]HCJ06884.1 chemotaxis protein CheD [Lachnospiraceae bacterium]